ncbi:patatin-like phospholipase family protein [Vibrio methylphosphonaticus]|uniref:patatin-like phospholipase family protein n=1 Tax=Vibrio methylphosphonaticus TaxID=2946866 RepID=UPI00202A8126|nr:patatin-like phospholipase family protein [Vibrio methylphosphonaticus]MCL9773920.1 patatin-like phospholipase family protein [Vibrio methylphosphonaticus]
MKNKCYSIIVMVLVLSACSSKHALDNRVNQENYKQVNIQHSEVFKGSEPYRFWGHEQPDFLLKSSYTPTSLMVPGDRLNILALSGGGANGAFGAGVINGLYDAGELPEYTLITGVSAGALIAPFVFTGGEDIHKLKDVMLSLDDREVLGKKNFLNTIFKDAFTNGKSLLELMENTYDYEMIDRIAEQHRLGKRLFIGTTHFDSGKQITWNIGEIAASELPNKQRLIHQILAASASIPGVFPPQFINVEYEGETLEELHVDGGLTFQMFFDPSNFDYGQISESMGLQEPPMVHVIRNGTLEPGYTRVKDKGVDLLTRSISNLTLQQTRGDMYRMLYMSEKNGYDIGFTYVDTSFKAHKKSKNMFDKDYMNNLYNYGYRKAQGQQLWVAEAP